MFQRVLLDFVLKAFGLGAENETRTRDPNLGKVVLYQLSYFRIVFVINILSIVHLPLNAQKVQNRGQIKDYFTAG